MKKQQNSKEQQKMKALHWECTPLEQHVSQPLLYVYWHSISPCKISLPFGLSCFTADHQENQKERKKKVMLRLQASCCNGFTNSSVRCSTRKKSLMTEHHGLEILLLKVKVTCLHKATKKEMTSMNMSMFYMQHQNVLWVHRLGLEKIFKKRKTTKSYFFLNVMGILATLCFYAFCYIVQMYKKNNPKTTYQSNPGVYYMHTLLPSHHELPSVELVQQAGLSSTDQRQQWCLPQAAFEYVTVGTA